MRLHRFLVEQSLDGSALCITDKALLHQWSRVLRYVGGEELMLIDGKGRAVTGTLRAVSSKEAWVDVRSSTEEPEETPSLTLFFSPLRRELTELVFQKGTELGVSTFQPILCDRTVRGGFHAERAGRILKEATEQSGRVWMPNVQAPISFTEALRLNTANRTYIASLGQNAAQADATKRTEHLALFVGPEGGWTDVEETLAKQAGCLPLRLSAHVLRAETACMAGVTLLRAASLI